MIPFLDLKAQYADIKPELDAAIHRVLDSGMFVLGPEVAAFETDFAAYCGGTHCVAVNSGTSALHLALLAAGIGPGDEVIAPAMTFVATVAPILYAGATPVLVDVDPKTWNIEPDAVEAAVTERTRAIIPVHLHGLPADMDPILATARRHGLTVIEDAAQAHGADYKGARVGSIGDIGCFSFYPGKNLGAYGEGGALVTNDPEIAETARVLRDWGQTAKHDHALRGFNYRMDGFQGAVLGVKLRHLDAWTEARRARAATYDARIAGFGLGTPAAPPDSRHVYHVYAIRVPDRDQVQAALQAHGVQTAIHYPLPVHLQDAYRALGRGAGTFPVAEQLGREFLSLPIYPELTESDVDACCAALAQALGAAGPVRAREAGR